MGIKELLWIGVMVAVVVGAAEFATFRGLVEERGGRVIDHIYVRRGRILWQMSDDVLLEESNKIAEQGSARWRSAGLDETKI